MTAPGAGPALHEVALPGEKIPREGEWPALAPVLMLAVSVPPLFVLALSLIVAVAGLAGYHPLWPAPEVNMAEAAATRDAATVLSLIERGRSPRERLPVRPGMLRSDGVSLTTLEAAVAARRLEIVHLILRHTDQPDARGRLVLSCFADRLQAREIVNYLRTAWAADGPPRCDQVRTPW